MSDNLRKECKMLKALQGISYKEMAEYLELKPSSFYSWLKGEYELSNRREAELREILTNLKEI